MPKENKHAVQRPEPFVERALAVLADLGPHSLVHLAENDSVNIHGLEDKARESALYTEHGPAGDLVAARHAEHAGCVRAPRLGAQHAEARVAIASPRRRTGWRGRTREGMGIHARGHFGILHRRKQAHGRVTA